MKRAIISTLFILTTIITAFADEVSFVASAPKSVVVGNRFKIAYEANTKTDSQPTISDVDGLRILSGPHHSTFMSSQNVNGRVTSKQTITYTYIVVADNEGDITIPGATVMVDGKKYTSNPLTIKVLPESQASSAAQQQGNRGGVSPGQGNNSSTNITNDNLFMIASVSKSL